VPPLRRSARVLVIDASGRVLLLRFRFHPADGSGYGWATPGGGIQGAESPATAAARELREEVGLAVDAAALGPVVAWTRGFARTAFVDGECQDEFFRYAVSTHDVDISGMEQLERTYHAGHRWFSADEIDACPEPIVPAGLGGLLRRLTSGATVTGPVRLPWHH
jgi:8-oxo-dGTP pyrophosphatase MutT (NUDIX family)